MFSVKGPRYAVNRRVLAEAGDSIKRFFDSGVLELGDKLGPMLWQFAPTKKFDAADFGAFLELLPREDRRPQAAPRRRGAPRLVLHAASSSRWCASSTMPVVFAEHENYPAIADPVGDFVYARLQKGDDAIPTAYPPKAARCLGRSAPALGQGRRARRPDRSPTRTSRPRKRRATCSSTSSTKARCAPPPPPWR